MISVVKLRYCVVNGIKDFQAIPSSALKLDLNNLCKLQIRCNYVYISDFGLTKNDGLTCVSY